jgi:hypothetical protein
MTSTQSSIGNKQLIEKLMCEQYTVIAELQASIHRADRARHEMTLKAFGPKLDWLIIPLAVAAFCTLILAL